MAAGWSEIDQDGSCNVFYDLLFQLQIITSTLFYLLELSHQVQVIEKGNWSPPIKGSHIICGHI